MISKPIKKSDEKKIKMRKRQNRQFTPNPEHHLIVSEGTKTEPNYFEALSSNVNQNVSFRGRERGEFVRFHIRGVGKNTRGVFNDAVEIAQEIEQMESVKISKVWVVYDKDDFADDRFNVVESLCKNKSTDETQYFALWSNQCIELWFLLHFEYCNSAVSRDDYQKKLSGHLLADGHEKKYEKNSKQIFEWLLPRLDNAMGNSKRLLATHAKEVPSAKKDPATVVHYLFEELRVHINTETASKH